LLLGKDIILIAQKFSLNVSMDTSDEEHILGLDGRFLFRHFRSSSDEEQCCMIENRSTQSNNHLLSKLFVVKLRNSQGITKRTELYQFGLTVVCEEKSTGLIAGYVMGGVKQGILKSGEEVKAAYFFGLKVDEQFQRLGLGTQLIKAAEKICEQEGATLFYVSVNDSNNRSKGLFQKLGYTHSSNRCLTMQFLDATKESFSHQCLRFNITHIIDPQQIVHILKQHLSQKDLTLNHTELLKVLSRL